MSIGNPDDWDYNVETLTEVKNLRFNDAVLQRLDPGNADRIVTLPVSKNQGKGCVIIENNEPGSAISASNIQVDPTHITNESDRIVLGPDDAVMLDYFSNSDPDENGFWIASMARYNT